MHEAAAVAALAWALAASTANATIAASGDPVLYWNEVVLAGISGDPSAQARTAAMVDVALHDAVNATLARPTIVT